MKIEVLYLEGCPNYKPALERLKNVLRQEGLPAEIEEVKVEDQLTAKARNFFGSPTIRINGLDIEPEARNPKATGFACRRYSGGAPSEEMIRSAIKEARLQHEG
jgi:hypothetical protein